MLTPAQAKAAIAVSPFRRAEQLEAIIDKEIADNCAHPNQADVWPMTINTQAAFADVIEQVVSRFTSAGWSMTIGAELAVVVERPT